MLAEDLKQFSKYTNQVLSKREIYALHLNANALGFSEQLITEATGARIADYLITLKRKNFLFVCSTGGKGAIGLSAARHLHRFCRGRGGANRHGGHLEQRHKTRACALAVHSEGKADG